MHIFQDIKHFFELLRQEKRDYSIGFLSLALLNVTDVLAPLFMAVAIDLTEADLLGHEAKTNPVLAAVGLSSGDFTIIAAISIFLGLHIASNIARYFTMMYVAVPSNWLGQSLRNKLVDKLLRLKRPFYDRSKSGDLMSLATADIQAVRMFLGPGFHVAGDTLMLVVLVLGLMLILSWKLTLIAILPLPIIALVTNKLAHIEYDRFEDVQQDVAELTERARESYAGIRIIQGYAREEFDLARFELYSWRHFKKNLRLATVRSFFEPTLEMMLGCSAVLILVFGGLQVVSGAMTLGTFVAFLFLIGFLTGPMIGFGWSVTLFQRGRASLKRLYKLLDEPDDVPTINNPPEHKGHGHVSIRDLSFAYASNDDGGEAVLALQDINIELEPGKKLGIIGAVGSGKSTLVNLLTRIYEPPENTIYLDGIDIRELPLESLRSVIVLAPQETFLFSDTIERNVLLAADDETQPAEHFLRLAQLHDEIHELEQGYQTMLGERGVNLSGGQRQRLAIARAIAANPQILILDDCLSAVDARTERAILENVNDIFAARSGIIVSHRVCAVQQCEHIIVLDEGRIVEQGTHSELLCAGGYYAEIASEQMKQEEENAA